MNIIQEYYLKRAQTLKNILPEGNIIGAEIGVNKGDFSRILLQMYPEIEKIYGIDPYIKSPKLYKKVKKMKYEFGSRFKLIRKSSLDSVDDIPDNLTFIHIDGNHTYNHVLQDIELYEAKVKIGGILCGHDYPSPKYPEVETAVDFYAKTYNRNLQSTKNTDTLIGMWWWIKT